MKKLFSGILLAGLFCPSFSTLGATKYWDVNGAANGSGQGATTGTWNTTTANWSTDSTGNSAATTFATGDIAIFSAGTDATNAFTISVPNAITTGGITVEEGIVSLTGAAVTNGPNLITIATNAELSIPGSSTIAVTNGASINLSGTMENRATASAGSFVSSLMTITLVNGGTLSFPTVNILNIVQTNASGGTIISGTGPLTKVGAGVLAIATACTYSGATIVSNGELRVRTINNPLPTTTDMVVVSPGIFNLNGLNQQIASLSGNGNVGTGTGTLTINGSSNTVFTGAISNIANAGASGVITGNGKLTKSGASTITFAGPNNINGNVTLTSGGIIVLSNASLCGPICDLNINGGTLTLSNSAQAIENLAGSGGTINLGPGHTLTSVPFSSATNSSVIAGQGGFTYSPPSNTFVQTLKGVCTYTGSTSITAGTLALGASGSINGTGTLILAAGATFDVSTQSSPYNLSASTTLVASGTGTNIGTNAATIVGPASGVVNLGSQPIALNYNGTSPALYVSQGSLSLNGNTFIINSSSPLAANTYVIARQASGTVAASGTFTVGGTALSTNVTAAIQVSGTEVDLVLTPAGSALPGQFTGVSTLPDKTLNLSFSGSSGKNYIVQAATNLTAPIVWTNLSTNLTDTNGLFQFNDLDSTNHISRFYRSSTP